MSDDDELFGLKSSRTGEYLHSESADEMFEKLGYKKLNKKELKSSFDDDFLELLLCVYEAPMYNFVYFYNDKTVHFTSSKNMQELQAINEKVKELGWNE